MSALNREAATCGRCRDCRYYNTDKAYSNERCLKGISEATPDFGCVLFAPKPQPVRRIVAIGEIPCVSTIPAYGELDTELAAGRLHLTPVEGYTHVASNDICAWLVSVDEETP